MSIMLKVLFFILIVIVMIKARRDTGSQLTSSLGIVGGRRTAISKVPWFAVISHKKKSAFLFIQIYYCAGSIVSNKIVLTTARCIKNMRINTALVRVGSEYKTKGGQKYYLKAYGTHPKYNPQLDIYNEIKTYDIGIIWLQNEIKFDFKINYIPLPDIDFNISESSIGQVCSFVKIGVKKRYIKRFHCVNLTTINCGYFYKPRNNSETENSMLCAGNSLRGACWGDFGSSFVSGNKLIGIKSDVVNCGNNGHPTIFVKVASLKNWIGDDQSTYTSYYQIIENILQKKVNVDIYYNYLKFPSPSYILYELSTYIID